MNNGIYFHVPIWKDELVKRLMAVYPVDSEGKAINWNRLRLKQLRAVYIRKIKEVTSVKAVKA